MNHSFHYFNDITCASEIKPTYKLSLDHHFECLDQIIYKLNFHNVKLSVNKSEFAKPKILLQKLLLKEPLFCNLIREDAVKYLWVDAASSSGCLGAVLAQQIPGKSGEKICSRTYKFR